MLGMGESKKSRQGLMATVAANVKSRRLRLGLSQEELADKCGYHRTYIGSIERGERNITVSTVEAVAAALQCEAADLLRADA